MTSRAALSRYILDNIESDRQAVVSRVAAWLVTHGKKRDAGHVVQDVALLMHDRGYVWARVTVARPVSSDALRRIEEFTKQVTHAKEVHLDVVVDPNHIGGVRIDTPKGSLDASIQAQLTDFIQGVK